MPDFLKKKRFWGFRRIVAAVLAVIITFVVVKFLIGDPVTLADLKIPAISATIGSIVSKILHGGDSSG